MAGFVFRASLAFVVAAVSSIGIALARHDLRAKGGSEQAVAYQINPAHSGSVTFSDGFALPLTPLWSISLPGYVSYPLIIHNLIYVTTWSTDSDDNTLYALNRKTGRILWQKTIRAVWNFSDAAYDNGRVFVVNDSGMAQAFNAKTGSLLWRAQLHGQGKFSSPPTASGGRVFTAGAGFGGTFYALDETRGALLWTASVENGDVSSPAIGDGGVFVSYPCQVYRFAPDTGHVDWRHDGGCEGGGGKTAVYSQHRLYARDAGDEAGAANLVLDARNGAVLGNFASYFAPAFFEDAEGQNRGVGRNYDGTLNCFDPQTGATVWNFTGDGHLSSAPIAVNGQVIEGSELGNLYVLDGLTGTVLWSTNVGHPIYPPDEQNGESLTGLGAGEGIVVVPAEQQLIAFAQASKK